MWKDPIVEEVRRVREEHAARFNYDLKAIVEDLMQEQRQSGTEVINLPPRRPVSWTPPADRYIDQASERLVVAENGDAFDE